MKILPLMAAMAFLCLSVQAQKKTADFPVFGKIEPSELSLKDCEFDKNAAAVVLFDVGKFTTNFTGGTVYSALEHHVRIKILTDKGFDEADIKIPYVSYKGQQSIRNLVAQTYNPGADGNLEISKVEKSLVYDKKINARVSHNAFTFPNVKAGSIIEYKYTIKGNGLQDWAFQRSIPVMLSRCIIDIPIEVEIASEQFGAYQVEVDKRMRSSNNVYTYTARNLPGFRDEPFITTDDDYLQRMQTTLVAFNFGGQRTNMLPTWPKVIKILLEDEDFGVQLKRDIPRTADLDEALKTITNPLARMQFIHDYVRKNMEWNGYTSLYALDGVKSAWKEKKGTSGEINLILINLLKNAGLNAKPVLVSTRGHGRISTSYPSDRQFDKVLAHVRIDGKVYVLDGTEKITSTRMIPLDVMYSEGLVIGKLNSDDWGWEFLWDDKKRFNTLMIFNSEMKSDGLIEGKATINSYDYARAQKMPILKSGKDKFVTHYFQSKYPNIKFNDVTIKNESADTLPLIEEVKYSLAANESGEYRYFTTNLFTGLETNPFISETRFSDVFFGANQQYTIVGDMTIPKGYAFDELPKNVRMIMPDTSIIVTRISRVIERKLSVRYTLEFKKPVYTPEEYPYFMSFYKKLFDLLNEQFVVKKQDDVANR